jgi:hypothetical protein
MRKHPFAASLLLAVAVCAPLITSGCAEHRYRVYDPYHSDYHRWDAHERVYFNQWVIETHREPHREFRDLDRDDQKAYWNWRHDHDRDHDHDHDRDRDHDRH